MEDIINRCMCNLNILNDFSTKMNFKIDNSFYRGEDKKTIQDLENEINHFVGDAITMMNSCDVSEQTKKEMSRRCNVLYRDIYTKIKKNTTVYSF